MLILKKLIRKIYFKTLGRYRVRFLINREIKNNWSVLDVGCGRPTESNYIEKGIFKVGLDIYEPYLKEREKQKTHNVLILGDARNLPFPDKFFDVVVATEVLEHLNKSDGFKMIAEMERVAKKKIILTTPNGYLPTYAGPNDNPKECHLSGWSYDELKKIGFKIRGLNGWKNFWTLRNGRAVPKLLIPGLSSVIIDLSEFFVYFYPQLAFHFFLVKEVNK